MTAVKTRKRGARRSSRVPRAYEARRLPVPVTFEFVTLREGSRRVAALEIVAGRHCLIDALPEGIERDALRAWLTEHGLMESRIDKTRSG